MKGHRNKLFKIFENNNVIFRRETWLLVDQTHTDSCECELDLSLLRVGIHHGPWKMAFFTWSDLVVRFPWSDYFKKLIYKVFGSSLGVNRMWNKRNDHVPKK